MWVRLTEAEPPTLRRIVVQRPPCVDHGHPSPHSLESGRKRSGAGLEGWSDHTDFGHESVNRAPVWQEFVESGLEAALYRRKPTRPASRKLDGAQEARLIALACGPAPEGRTR